MHPIITQVGPLYIYSYGLMVAIGFAAATLLACKHASEFGLDKEKIIDLGIVLLLCGVVGGRLLYVILNIKYYISHPVDILNLTKGGLVWYGAFIFAIIGAALYVKKNKLDFWKGADLFAPYIALAQAIGRIGCFLNGCCYGIEAPRDYALSIVFPNECVFRHPTQIYSSIALLVIFAILRRWQRSIRFKGEVFLGYGLLYSLARFGLEFLRGDNVKIWAGLTMSQLISIAIFALSLAVFIYRSGKWKNSSPSA